MVHLAEVREFVENDVVADEDRSLDKTPIERDGAAAGTGTPAGTLVADADAADGETVRGGEFEDAGRKFFCGKEPKVAFDGRSEVECGGRDLEELVREGDLR